MTQITKPAIPLSIKFVFIFEVYTLLSGLKLLPDLWQFNRWYWIVLNFLNYLVVIILLVAIWNRAKDTVLKFAALRFILGLFQMLYMILNFNSLKDQAVLNIAQSGKVPTLPGGFITLLYSGTIIITGLYLFFLELLFIDIRTDSFRTSLKSQRLNRQHCQISPKEECCLFFSS